MTSTRIIRRAGLALAGILTAALVSACASEPPSEIFFQVEVPESVYTRFPTPFTYPCGTHWDQYPSLAGKGIQNYILLEDCPVFDGRCFAGARVAYNEGVGTYIVLDFLEPAASQVKDFVNHNHGRRLVIRESNQILAAPLMINVMGCGDIVMLAAGMTDFQAMDIATRLNRRVPSETRKAFDAQRAAMTRCPPTAAGH